MSQLDDDEEQTSVQLPPSDTSDSKAYNDKKIASDESYVNQRRRKEADYENISEFGDKEVIICFFKYILFF